VAKNLSSVKATEPFLKKLHRLLFGSSAKKHVIKKNIRLFTGYDSDDKDKLKHNLEEKLNKIEKGDLKEISRVLDQNYGGSKVDLVAGLIDFLLDPKPSKASKSSSKGSGKRKRSTKKGSKKKKTKKEKRAPSGYILYSKHVRPKVKEEDPSKKFPELTQEVAKRWQALGDSGQEKWNEKAKKLKKQDASDSEEEAEPKKKKKKEKSKKKEEEREGQGEIGL